MLRFAQNKYLTMGLSVMSTVSRVSVADALTAIVPQLVITV